MSKIKKIFEALKESEISEYKEVLDAVKEKFPHLDFKLKTEEDGYDGPTINTMFHRYHGESYEPVEEENKILAQDGCKDWDDFVEKLTTFVAEKFPNFEVDDWGEDGLDIIKEE